VLSSHSCGIDKPPREHGVEDSRRNPGVGGSPRNTDMGEPPRNPSVGGSLPIPDLEDSLRNLDIRVPPRNPDTPESTHKPGTGDSPQNSDVDDSQRNVDLNYSTQNLDVHDSLSNLWTYSLAVATEAGDRFATPLLEIPPEVSYPPQIGEEYGGKEGEHHGGYGPARPFLDTPSVFDGEGEGATEDEHHEADLSAILLPDIPRVPSNIPGEYGGREDGNRTRGSSATTLLDIPRVATPPLNIDSTEAEENEDAHYGRDGSATPLLGILRVPSSMKEGEETKVHEHHTRDRSGTPLLDILYTPPNMAEGDEETEVVEYAGHPCEYRMAYNTRIKSNPVQTAKRFEVYEGDGIFGVRVIRGRRNRPVIRDSVERKISWLVSYP